LSNHTEASQGNLTRRLLPALLAVLAVLVAPLAISLGSTALADTAGSPDPNTRANLAPAVANAGTGVTPTGSLVGAVGGQTVNIHIDGVAGKFNGVQIARLCRAGLNITTSSQLSPTSFGNCIANPLPGAANDAAVGPVSAAPTNQQVDFTFRVGSGTETSHPGPGLPITCDAANPCALWLQESVDTTIAASGSIYKHYEVLYAGTPSAPQGATGSGGNTTATYSWSAPANLANGTLQNYTVTLSPGGATQTVAGTTATFSGLTNFTAYTASIVANTVASDGTTTFAGAPATATATPGPAGVQNLAATPSDQAVTLSWNPPAGPAPVSYEVSVAPSIPGSPFTAAGSPLTVNGLTNGTVYTFSVRAFYGAGNFGSSSSVSATPNGTLVTQHIYVSRPQGSLVLTQVCGTGTGFGNTSAAPYSNGVVPPNAAPVAPGTSPTPGNQSTGVGTPDPLFSGYPYPQDPNTGLALFTYPTDCRVDLGAAKLITSGPGAGQYFKADGKINQVTVVDTRDTDPGWTVNGQSSSFISGANQFSGNDLGWHPVVTSFTPGFTSPDGVYAQIVTAGPDSTTPAGLATARQLAHAPAKANIGPNSNTGGLGIAQLDADLHLLIPIFAIHGNYVSILSITAV
jgi:hypothetical protein